MVFSYGLKFAFTLFLSWSPLLWACLSCPVSTGVGSIPIEGGKITIEDNITQKCLDDFRADRGGPCLPVSTMAMERGGKTYDLTSIVKEWEGFYIYFVKIRRDQYTADLNDDGKKEFALVPMLSGGGAIIVDAFLYTIKEQGVEPYGQGRFFWERGENVQLGCPNCWKFDMDKCKSCR